MSIKNIFYSLVLALPFLSGCNEYNKILKSKDVDEKYEYAKMYYEQKKYSRASTLLTDVVPIYRGTEMAEDALYLLSMSYFNMHDYISSGEYFQRYINNYPRGSKVQQCRFNMAYGDYQDSPDARLDQSVTKKAIKELDHFIELYPRSELADSATVMRIELSDRLCYKEYLSAKLYLNLGTYMGNNYEAAVITARNAQDDYPYSKYREDLGYVILRARYEAAINSIEEKAEERYREAYDEYFTFTNEYPESSYKKEVEKMYAKLSKKMAEYGE
ncbi:MAG: outer membrane protein assembly factor BamD [Bacteroidales bacterium]|nr:outer membrane protein assembly factor BamD [Bacteroidales bacterium]